MSALVLQLVAFWPVWRWYFTRITDGSDEPWGVVALLTAITIALMHPRKSHDSGKLHSQSLALLVFYFIAYPYLPAMGKAVIAVLCLASELSVTRFGRRLHLGITALLLLSLPIIASLQFYAGYPLRLVTGQVVSFLLNASGEAVSASGTIMRWRGDFISIDAPCSGIKMLWTGLYLAFTLASANGLSNSRTWLAYVSASFAIFCANVVRTYVLFFTEARILSAPSWFHTTWGITCFCSAAILILYTNKVLRSSDVASSIRAYGTTRRA